MKTIKNIVIDEQQQYEEGAFPSIYFAEKESASFSGHLQWLHDNQQALMDELENTGAILFRGFQVDSIDEFDAFVSTFDQKPFLYNESLSNAVRVNYTERVFSSNEAPSDFKIKLHHEMAQTPSYPDKLFFYCLQPAEKDGATPLCRSDILYNFLAEQHPIFLKNCEEKGLCYTHSMNAEDNPQQGNGRGWRSTLKVDDKAGAEQALIKLKYTWQWLNGDNLEITTPPLPAVKILASGKKTFFNQLIAWASSWKENREATKAPISYGNGTPLDYDAVEAAVVFTDSITFDLCWRQGDVALIDNKLVMHGRRSFTGQRRVLAAFVA